MAVIIIIFISWILYKAGAIRRLLIACKLPEPETPQARQTPQEPQEGREKWETEAAYILQAQGMNPAAVKHMGDEMLLHIIRDYLDI